MRSLFKFSYTFVRRGVVPLGWYASKNAFSLDVKNYPWRVVGEALAEILSHAGPVWTKLGQILATRDNLLPKSLCAQLEKLYSSQSPMPHSEVRKILRREFHDANVLRHLQKKPLGVGSIGQVHRAKTIDGDRVVLKILRPNTREKLKADFEFMEWILARVKSLRLNSESLFFVEKILFDLKNSMEKEANLLLEKNSILRFQKKYNRSQRFYVPKVYDELCTSQVLVMEEIKGESLAQLRKSRLIGKKRKREIAEQVLKEVMTQILVDGDFHADPHAGNIYLMEDGRVAFIDLGLTGQFTGEDRKKLSKAIQALLDRNPEKVFDALLGFGEVSNDFDREKFKKEVSEIVKANRKGVQDYASGGEGVSLESFVDELFQAAFRNGVYVPSDTTLLIKTLITVEGVARSLHPQLNLVKSTVPVVMTAIMPKWLRWPLGKR